MIKSALPPTCLRCRYVRNLSMSGDMGKFCGYFLLTGRRRGCPGGDGCRRFEEVCRRGKSEQ